ncbi:phosphotyrosine protein phosphatase [Vibrio sp. AND4]|uniref:arsenate reductase/protein-tyrosine-phosphatase family protein n=1 Tax=Vibrio sp. AND4 TaxID=314289 RepID=UPI00015F3411|nr:phosphotyrosine protein phosphatase [Vibrio sp. AND4]EDP59683.1 putative phosphatase [Vibrio sp. AND4]
MFSNILVVCVGNICRSPTGERILQRLLPDKTISSAGIAVEKSRLTGKPADETATQIASNKGVSLADHQAQQLTAQLCAKQDLILVMEHGHIDALTEMVPEARGKTMLFGHWINSIDIPDPYRQSREAFDHAFSLIEKSAHAWAKRI